MRPFHLIAIGVFSIAHLAFPPVSPTQLQHPLPLGEVGVGSVDGVRLDGISSVDRSGHNVTGIGDFNGDGIEDFMNNGIIADPNGVDRAGEAYLILGSRSGIGAGGQLSMAALDGTNGFIIEGTDNFGQLGASVAGAGDFNGDGFDDALVVGNREDWEGTFDTGVVYLLWGGPALPGVGGVLDLANLTEDVGVAIPGLGAGWNLAYAGGAGDINADGIDDFLMAASFLGRAELNLAGEVYLVYGSPVGLGTDGVFDLASLDGTNGVRIPSLGVGQHLWGPSGIGDFNGDGIDDFVACSHRGPTADESAPGEAYVIFGSREQIGTAGVFDIRTLDGENGLTIRGGQPGEHMGRELRGVGDFNGDGLADLLLPAFDADVGGLVDAGRSYLIWGSQESMGAGGFLDLSQLSPDDGVRIEGYLPGRRVGVWSGGAGDVNGDGLADLLMGKITTTGMGEAYMIYGSSEGLGENGIFSLADLDGTNGVGHLGVHSGDATGRGMGHAGDPNGDGISDYLVGAYISDVGAIREAGRAYLIHGQSPHSSATYVSWLPAGDTGLFGIGRTGDGTHSTPFSRCWLGFFRGQGEGPGGASSHAVTLSRTGGEIGELAKHAAVMWTVESEREGPVFLRARLRYLESEIVGLDESDLTAFWAPEPEGPWKRVPMQARDAARNEISLALPVRPPERRHVVHFALAERHQGGIPHLPSATLNAVLGRGAAPVGADFNLDGLCDVADLTLLLEAESGL